MKQLPVILLTAALCGLTLAEKTDKCTRGYKHCGDQKCCCRNTTAACKGFHKKLNYIPPLPANITEIQFQNNFLPEINQGTFHNVSQANIVFLSLTYNEIHNVSSDAFLGFRNLRTLELTGNVNMDLRKLSLSFGSISRTNSFALHLEKIRMSTLTDDFFENLSDANVTKINLNNNGIKLLNMKAFQSMQHLTSLGMKDNFIQEMTDGVGHDSIENLDLSKNEIARKPFVFCLKSKQSIFPNLRHLDLTSNYISDISGHPWRCLYRLQFLSLSGNVLRIIRKDSFKYLYNVDLLRLDNMIGSIERIEGGAFNNEHLRKISLEKNSIVFRAPSINDIFKGCSYVKSLDLSHNNFRYLSGSDIMRMLSPMQNLQELTLVSGKIYRLPEDFLHAFPNLTKINLDGNRIDNIKNVFVHAKNITTLSLQSNNIRVVDRACLSDSLIKSINNLNLALNPLECTCEMLWFRNAISDMGTIGSMQLKNWPGKYTCATPSSKKNTLFIDFHPTSLGCRNVLLISGITLASALILALVVTIVSYRYRWYIAYYLYKIRSKRKRMLTMTEDQPLLEADLRHYNGFVIYEEEDRSFVRNNLQQLMEVRNDFKLHIWDRNSVPGSSKLEEVADVIYASDCVIAVISKTAVRDSWIKFQLDVASDRQVALNRNFLILVFLEDIEFNLLNKFWCMMFARMPCVRWCDQEDDVRRTVFEQQLIQHCSTARQLAIK